MEKLIFGLKTAIPNFQILLHIIVEEIKVEEIYSYQDVIFVIPLSRNQIKAQAYFSGLRKI